MTPERWNNLLALMMSDAQAVLSSKADEYASANDRFHNFKQAAAIDNETPERALWGMTKKHLISIVDGLRLIDNGITPSLRFWVEKLGDMRNYLFLLEGLIIERIENEDSQRAKTEASNAKVGSKEYDTSPGTLNGHY